MSILKALLAVLSESFFTAFFKHRRNTKQEVKVADDSDAEKVTSAFMSADADILRNGEPTTR